MEDKRNTSMSQTGGNVSQDLAFPNNEMLLDTSNNTTKQSYRYSKFMDNPNLSRMNDTTAKDMSLMKDTSYNRMFNVEEVDESLKSSRSPSDVEEDEK